MCLRVERPAGGKWKAVRRAWPTRVTIRTRDDAEAGTVDPRPARARPSFPRILSGTWRTARTSCAPGRSPRTTATATQASSSSDCSTTSSCSPDSATTAGRSPERWRAEATGRWEIPTSWHRTRARKRLAARDGGGPVVGHERGDGLAAAARHHFEPVGPLRIRVHGWRLSRSPWRNGAASDAVHRRAEGCPRTVACPENAAWCRSCCTPAGECRPGGWMRPDQLGMRTAPDAVLPKPRGAGGLTTAAVRRYVCASRARTCLGRFGKRRRRAGVELRARGGPYGAPARCADPPGNGCGT